MGISMYGQQSVSRKEEDEAELLACSATSYTGSLWSTH